MTITIDEAIHEQELFLKHSDQWTHDKLDLSIQLGIEALEHLKWIRDGDCPDPTALLTREAKE